MWISQQRGIHFFQYAVPASRNVAGNEVGHLLESTSYALTTPVPLSLKTFLNLLFLPQFPFKNNKCRAVPYEIFYIKDN